MDDSDDIDRAAILARRRRFMLAALGGIAGAGACARVEPPRRIENVEISDEQICAPRQVSSGSVESSDPLLVAEAAAAAGDYEKAWTYLETYLQYNDGSHADHDRRAKELLATLLKCGGPEPRPQVCLSLR